MLNSLPVLSLSMTSFKMPFTEEDKHLIKVLGQEKRYSSRRFLKEFPTRNWSCRLTLLIEKNQPIWLSNAFLVVDALDPCGLKQIALELPS